MTRTPVGEGFTPSRGISNRTPRPPQVDANPKAREGVNPSPTMERTEHQFEECTP